MEQAPFGDRSRSQNNKCRDLACTKNYLLSRRSAAICCYAPRYGVFGIQIIIILRQFFCPIKGTSQPLRPRQALSPPARGIMWGGGHALPPTQLASRFCCRRAASQKPRAPTKTMGRPRFGIPLAQALPPWLMRLRRRPLQAKLAPRPINGSGPGVAAGGAGGSFCAVSMTPSSRATGGWPEGP